MVIDFSLTDEQKAPAGVGAPLREKETRPVA
jgi:hypothetical protein